MFFVCIQVVSIQLMYIFSWYLNFNKIETYDFVYKIQRRRQLFKSRGASNRLSISLSVLFSELQNSGVLWHPHSTPLYHIYTAVNTAALCLSLSGSKVVELRLHDCRKYDIKIQLDTVIVHHYNMASCNIHSTVSELYYLYSKAVFSS